MSLDVPGTVLHAAEHGPVDDAAFLAVVRDSPPYAWQVVTAAAADRDGKPFGEHEVPPPSEQHRGQLLRALTSNAIRALERHFGIVLAFQNCHRVAAFDPAAVDGPDYRAFTSVRGQLLNQSPERRNC
jgi:hypothetical protein